VKCDHNAGTEVDQLRLVDGSWKKLKSQILPVDCTTTFRIRAKFKRATFAFAWSQQNEFYLADQSKNLTIRTRKRSASSLAGRYVNQERPSAYI
jgi:hypothetical protein